METYADLHQKIVDDTGREDLSDPAIIAGGSGRIKRRIQRAVLKFHRIDFWKKDLNIQEYAFTNNQAVQAMKLSLFPRFRSVLFIRRFDSSILSTYTSGAYGAWKSSFEEINPEKMLDGYGYDRRETMYRVGDEIHLNGLTAFQSILMGWYQDPQLVPIETSQSWILLNYQDLVAAEVKKRIFKDSGKDEEAKQAEEDIQRELLILQANNIRLSVM